MLLLFSSVSTRSGAVADEVALDLLALRGPAVIVRAGGRHFGRIPSRLEDVRWNLERIAVKGATDGDDDVDHEAALANLDALRSCTDDTLETLLEVSAAWHQTDDGAVYDSL